MLLCKTLGVKKLLDFAEKLPWLQARLQQLLALKKLSGALIDFQKKQVVVVVVSPLAELSLMYVGLSGILVVVKTLRYICWACVSGSVVEK